MRSTAVRWFVLATVGVALGACGGGATSNSSGPSTQGAPAASTKAADTAATPAAAKSAATAAASTAAKLEACKLVTKDEAVAVAGPVLDAIEEPQLTPMLAGCRFPNVESPIAAEVSVTLVAWPDAATAASEMKSTIQRNKYEEVSGIGEQAYTTWPLPGVAVRKGKYEVSITVSPISEEGKAKNVARTKTLLEKALPRLP